ncbi:MAG: flagellar protein FlaG [Acidobacteriota bacterium]|nr:MAG: flagellar protein FlaG [Acidobacteriota bacterium]
MTGELMKSIQPVASSLTANEHQEGGAGAIRPRSPAADESDAQRVEDQQPAPAEGTKESAAATIAQVTQALGERLEEIRARGYLRELRLDYEIREEGQVMVKILDAKTDKVIRTVPQEEQLELARRMDEYLGVLLDKTA